MKKLPYIAPLIEIDEYCVEIGVDASFVTNNQEVTENTDWEGGNDPGGDWDDDGGTGWFDF